MKRVVFIFLMMAIQLACYAQTTLDDCQRAAQQNYPLIRRTGLIEKTTDITVSNLAKKGWLPQIEAYGQGTMQSDVAALPDALTGMMSQMGYEVKGLSKYQYKVGLNVNQTVYDGGAIGAQREVARAQGQIEQAQNDVNLYNVRARVNELFFSILLVDANIELVKDRQALLLSNEEQLAKMLKGGVAMECDYNSVHAERITADRQITELQATRRQLQQLLAAFTGQQVGVLQKPAALTVQKNVNRPELRLADSQLLLADAQERQVKAGLMPKVGAFAQGYYGYPGYDMFHDMYHRNATFNGIVGLKLSWNISNFFTRKGDLAKVEMQRRMAENGRETFLFNNQLEQVQQMEEMEKYRQMIRTDEEIVALRAKVRQSHESKLRHGIINVNDLLTEITRENNAKTEMTTHEIQWLKAQYDLKYTVNE